MSAIPVGPITGSPTNFTVTGSSVHFDLTATTYETLYRRIQGGGTLTLKGDGDVFYRWSKETSGETVDETMVATGGTPANQCARLFAGERSDEIPPAGTRGLVVKGPIATILRIYPS